MAIDVSANLGIDFYLLDELLTDEEREVRDKVRAFCKSEVTPIINDYWDKAQFPFELVSKIADLNIAGGTIEGYGCPGQSEVASGLVGAELAYGDGSVCAFFGAHSWLVMGTIAALGTEEQREKWLPQMAQMNKLGAFGLTEPGHSSDIARNLQTRVERKSDGYVINGAKRWVGNASFADVTIIWARDQEDNRIKGFLVEKGTPGFHAEVITGKMSDRASWQTDITLEEVRVPKDARLEGANGFGDIASVLFKTRYLVAWEALGHATACYEAALTYAKEREIFGRSEASYQLIQNKLANMLAELTNMQLMCHRLSRLLSEGKMTPGMASLAKMSTAKKGKQVCAEARDIMGGNGILLEYHVARHLADMEAVYTYEGTDIIQSLIVGREITGVQAFS